MELQLNYSVAKNLFEAVLLPLPSIFITGTGGRDTKIMLLHDDTKNGYVAESRVGMATCS